MRGNTWVLLGEWGRGYRGTSERQHMGTTGGMGAGLQRHYLEATHGYYWGEWLSLNRLTAALFLIPLT